MRRWAGPAVVLLALPTSARNANAQPVVAPAPPTPTPTPPAFNRLALQTEGAIGVSGPFYNHLVGARFDHCFTQSTCLGGYGAYANLKGQSGRASNVLVYAMLEHRRPLGSAWHVPLRVAAGYLPRNGPFARLSAGLSVAIGNVDLTFDLIAPTLWVTGNDPVVSMDVAAEFDVRF